MSWTIQVFIVVNAHHHHFDYDGNFTMKVKSFTYSLLTILNNPEFCTMGFYVVKLYELIFFVGGSERLEGEGGRTER